MCSWIGDGFNENQARALGNRFGHSIDRCRVNKTDVDAHLAKGIEQAVGVTKEKGAGNHMIAGAQQRKQSGADGCHAGAETDASDTIFHCGDFRLQRRNRWIYLSAVAIAAFFALEYSRQIAGILVAVGHVGMYRFM